VTVALRTAMRRNPDAELGALAFAVGAFTLCTAGAILDGGESTRLGSSLLPFVAAGVMAPGMSGILFTRAIRAAGPARTSVVVGSAPLLAVVIAVTLLDEPAKAALLAGAVLIVAGGVLLLGERVRPHDFRLTGLWLAFGAAVLFASRDNLVRWLATDTDVPPLLAAATAAGAATAFLLVWIAVSRGGVRVGPVRPFVPAAVLAGCSYLALFEAYFRGKVTVVSPLVATEALFGVLAAAVLIGSSELIGRRLVAGAALTVAGGILIGVVR
jgi:drug/metabolite transporter (DMT)-like permease